MSRHVAQHTSDDSKHVEYGFDARPFPGYFALFVTTTSDGEEEQREYDTRELMAFDEHASRGQLVGLLKEYDLPEEHSRALALDRPF